MGSSPVFFCRDAPPMGAFFLRETLKAAKLCPVPLEYNGTGQSFFSFIHKNISRIIKLFPNSRKEFPLEWRILYHISGYELKYMEEYQVSANREYKDSVFSLYLSNPERLIEVYNAVADTNYPPDTPVEINTLTDVLYKN